LYVIGILLVILVGLYVYTNSVEPFASAPAGYKPVSVSIYLQLDKNNKVVASSSTDPNVKADTGSTGKCTITITKYIMQDYALSGYYNGKWNSITLTPATMAQYNNNTIYPASHKGPIGTVALPFFSTTGKITPKLPIASDGPNKTRIYKVFDKPVTFTGLVNSAFGGKLNPATTSTDNKKSSINANIRIDLSMIVPV
jgi:hypothetical protein